MRREEEEEEEEEQEEEIESGGREKKTRKRIVIAVRRAAISIAREARLVSNLTRGEARRKLTEETAVEGDRRFSIDPLNRRSDTHDCFSIATSFVAKK